MKKEKITEKYKKFINDLELKEINLVESEMKLSPSFSPPARVDIDEEINYSNKRNNIIEINFKLSLKCYEIKKKKSGMNITANYKLIYKSKTSLDKEVFALFKAREVRIQLWPYFREFVHHMTFYMGLPPLALHLIKIKFESE